MKTFLNAVLQQAQAHLDDPRAVRYLEARGFPIEQARLLGVGYIPEDQWPPRVTGSSVDAEAWARWSSNGYRLRGKIVFPITNVSGMLRGLQIRSPDPDKKDYSKFYLDKSGIDAVFFGTPQAMPEIWRTRKVFLCEGLFDLPPLMRVFPNSLCTGTANVSTRQFDFLKRWVDEVVVVFDTDWGGDRFWEEFQEKHGGDFRRTSRLSLPAKDTAELWERVGERRFRELLEQRVSF